MSDETTVRRTLATRRRGKTDWARVDALTDEEIEAAVAADPDAAPLLGREWFATAERRMPKAKRPVSLRLDPEVLDYFKRQGPRYQTRINAVLRAYIDTQTDDADAQHAPQRDQRQGTSAKNVKTGRTAPVGRLKQTGRETSSLKQRKAGSERPRRKT